MWLILTSIVISTFTWIYLKNKRGEQKKILGVYTDEGRWYTIKYFAMLFIFKLRKISFSLKKGSAGMGYGVKGISEVEKLQPLSSEEKAFDAVFYHGVSNNGYYFVGGIERRHNSKVNGLVYLLVPNVGLLHSEHMPKTELQADSKPKDSFAGGGISFKPVTPMKEWKISYSGRMWTGDDKNKKWYNVKFQGAFTSDKPPFVVDTDSDQRCLARALAREIWSREYFKTLEKAHQTHYEQMGLISATLTVDDKVTNVKMMGFRDHSFGAKRDWTLLHRYIFHMFYLVNDVRISVGVVSQPTSMSHFEIGYVVNRDKTVHPIQSCDLKLYHHGEDGNPPKTIAFSFTANNKDYNCRVDNLYDSVHYKGNNVEAKLYERFFVCEVNGIKGRGVSEWHYNNMGTYTQRKS